jgi:ABC-2 type transport system ATP-binding protein
VLELIDLHRRFGDTVALDGVSFAVPEGSIVGFVGRNGAGKTTAMRIALGVLAADAGEVRWRGGPVDLEIRRRFGYMPEERGLYPRMRVLEQLTYLGRLHGLPADHARARGLSLVERLQVAASPEDRVESLSLGNQQRVQLAAAMVHDPELLVLDEPFSGLDPTGVDVLAEVLAGEARGRGVPVVFSSHQLELVERLCDAVVLIDRGRIVADGTIGSLRASRARRLLRVEVAGASEDWFAAIPGVRLDGTAGPGTVLELDEDADAQRVLDLARAQGEVRAFAPVELTLAQLFREVVDEGEAP